MPSNLDKSTEKDLVSELVLMRMSIKSLRDRMNDSLNAIDERISSMMPIEESRRSENYRNFTTEQWRNFLEF